MRKSKRMVQYFLGLGGRQVVGLVDSGTKTVVVKTADGAEHTFHFLGRTIVHGTEATAKGSKDAFHGLKEGSEVAVHYTAKGGRETADEVDHIGKDGLKMTERVRSRTSIGAPKPSSSRRPMDWLNAPSRIRARTSARAPKSPQK
jgi:hypothetical protein